MNLKTTLKDWGPLVGVGFTLITLWTGRIKEATTKDNLVAQMKMDVAEIKSNLAGYQALQLKLGDLEKRVEKVETATSEGKVDMAGIKEAIQGQNRLLNSISGDIKILQQKN